MNARQVQLREFQFPVDYEQVYHLWQSLERGVHVGRSDTLMEIRKKVTCDLELFPVAEVNGAIVGSVVGGLDGRCGLIYHLAVATPFHSQGTGSRLMN